MRALLQRVDWANVVVAGTEIGAITHGFLILLGIRKGDDKAQAEFLAKKIQCLRVFEDEAGKMNWDLMQVGGEALVVPQFTLHADTRKGRRPAFSLAEEPEKAEDLYHYFCSFLKDLGIKIATGQFGAEMMVSLQNNGPVTLLLESDNEK